jgi:hypothetical protein
VLLTLLACLEPAPRTDLATTPEAARPPGHERAEPEVKAALPEVALPQPPFTARSRVRPTTLVDKHGTPALVLRAVGVQLEVTQLLPDRALVTCTGCRAPVEAWVQRGALWVQGAEAGEGLDEELLQFLDGQEELPEVARHGFVGEDLRRTAPPWYDEGGYAGPVLVAIRSKGGWTLELQPAAPEGATP